jgi:penicillin-binding protein 2
MLNYFPSLSFRNETIRQYQYPNHFSGYVGKINAEELKTYGDKYTLNSRIGKTGLERYYETMLVGTAGYEVLQVDASGKNLNFFRHNLHQDPEHGANLILSIDNRLQHFISEEFPKNMRGSVVVMDVKTGGILAYVSKPDFDPNLFVTGISVDNWNALMNDKSKPMLDRIIHGTYPPGSVYKPVTGSLGLEMQVIDSTTELAECVGGMQVGNRFFKCWNHRGHGFVNITEALKYSCDVFFYDLSTNFTLKQMSDYTKDNYITIRTGVDLVGERRGFFPTQQWYEDNYGKHISILGQKINMAIGQGELLVTPLQMCAYFNALAHDGEWIRPHFLHKVITPRGTREYHAESKPLPLHPENLALIQDALYQTVNGYRGTGEAAKLDDVVVYGKTGSAENHMGEETHAWFCGYAAWDEPEISFTVFVENAGGGGHVAAPIARKIVSYYHTLKQEKPE